MDENTTKPQKTKQPQKNRLTVFFENLAGEFRKIVWPTRAELFKQTCVVIVISLFVGALIFGLDFVFGYIQTFVTELT